MFNFASLPIKDLDKGKISWGAVQELVAEILEDYCWYLDENQLYIVGNVVSNLSHIYGPDTEMREAMHALLMHEPVPFYRYELGQYLRLDALPLRFRHFDEKHGFYVA